MSVWDQRADLKRIEPLIRTLGAGIWLFVGLSRWHGATRPPPWIWPWLVYGAAFLLCSLHRHLPRWLATAGLGLQTLAVLPLPTLGFAGYEGLLLSIVTAQAPILLPLRLAVAWALAQLVPLVAIVWSANQAVSIAEILGAYSTFSAFALLVYWLQQSERETRRVLASANVEILGARSLVVEGVRQGERLRISRELHDSLGHQLTALRLQLELAGRHTSGGDSSLEALTKARGIAREAIANLREVVKAIRSEDWLDFPGALSAMAAELPDAPITIEASEGFSVSGETAHLLFRCIQEAVTNSLKHSDGHRIWVTLSQSPAGIEVLVRDDGQNIGAIVPGFGLRGIQTHAAQLGGKAHCGPNPSGGFEVRIAVPRGQP